VQGEKAKKKKPRLYAESQTEKKKTLNPESPIMLKKRAKKKRGREEGKNEVPSPGVVGVKKSYLGSKGGHGLRGR